MFDMPVIQEFYGKQKSWYCLSHFIESGHSSLQCLQAPVYVGPSIAKELGMKAEPWEHIMLIGLAHDMHMMRPNNKSFACIAAVKYVWDTRKITEVKYFDDYKIFELYKSGAGKRAKDSHELLGKQVDEIYDKLEQMHDKLIKKA